MIAILPGIFLTRNIFFYIYLKNLLLLFSITVYFTTNLELSAANGTHLVVAMHPNKRQFLGLLTICGQPSDKAPVGARGHRVILSSDAAREQLSSLVGMGVNLADRHHKPTQKCGVIESAEMRGNEIYVEGHLWVRDLPHVVSQIEASEDWGMSYEIAEAHINDTCAEVWTIERFWFTGAAIMPREKAAYKTTQFILL